MELLPISQRGSSGLPFNLKRVEPCGFPLNFGGGSLELLSISKGEGGSSWSSFQFRGIVPLDSRSLSQGERGSSGKDPGLPFNFKGEGGTSA